MTTHSPIAYYGPCPSWNLIYRASHAALASARAYLTMGISASDTIDNLYSSQAITIRSGGEAPSSTYFRVQDCVRAIGESF